MAKPTPRTAPVAPAAAPCTVAPASAMPAPQLAAPPAVQQQLTAAPPAATSVVQLGNGVPPVPAAARKPVPATLGPVAGQLATALLAHMQPGVSYTTRQLVLALGRRCGQKEGGPVINALHRLQAQGKVAGKQQGAAVRAPWVWQVG